MNAISASDSCRSDGGAIQHEVRNPAQQHLVFRAHRLSLASVRDDDRPTAALSDRPQLLARREASPAPPAKARRFDQLDHAGGLVRTQGRRQNPVPLRMLVERHRFATRSEVSEQAGAVATIESNSSAGNGRRNAQPYPSRSELEGKTDAEPVRRSNSPAMRGRTRNNRMSRLSYPFMSAR